MTYVLTYRTKDEDAYGKKIISDELTSEFLVDSWENKPTRNQLVKCGISSTFNNCLHKQGTLYLNGRIYKLKETNDTSN